MHHRRFLGFEAARDFLYSASRLSLFFGYPRGLVSPSPQRLILNAPSNHLGSTLGERAPLMVKYARNFPFLKIRGGVEVNSLKGDFSENRFP